MRFLLHGAIHPDTQAALVKHQHACHTMLELSEDTTAPEELANDPLKLLPLLVKKQWSLVTSDSEFVQAMYEHHFAFPNVIIFLLESKEDDPRGQAEGIERLFERYPRLTARRMYTVTPSRVKIRQLPGAAAAG
jgi:hypothetical protein